MAAETNSSDEEIISPCRRRLDSFKKLQQLSDSDEDENSLSVTENNETPSGRRSDRIRRRQSREFRLPDRHKYREQISPKSQDLLLKCSSPRKAINNLTKINNRYNAETYDTDEDDDELSDFIIYDDEIEDEEESSDDSDMEQRKSRIDRNKTSVSASKHRRLREVSSSDSEPESKTKAVDKQNFNKLKDSDEVIDNKDNTVGKETKITSSSDNESDGSETILVTNSSKKKRKLMSSSDSDSSGNSSEPYKSATARIQQRQKHRQELFKELKDSRRKSK